MIPATQLRPGNVIKYEGELFSVFSVSHRTPGNKRGFVQAKLRNLRSGSLIEHRFRSDDAVEQAIIDQQEMEYLYNDGDDFHFMNTETFEQIHLPKSVLGEGANYLTPNVQIKVEFYEGNPVGVELPPTVDMAVSGNRTRLERCYGQQCDQASHPRNGFRGAGPPLY